jgi:hypothetical protein
MEKKQDGALNASPRNGVTFREAVRVITTASMYFDRRNTSPISTLTLVRTLDKPRTTSMQSDSPKR